MKIFHFPGTCALASVIALNDAGATHEVVRVDVAGGEQTRPAYLAINPKGRVPALVTERGILTETPAILAYIAQTYPAARLAPLDDPFAFAEMQAVNSYFCSTVHVAHAHKTRGKRWADDPAAIEDMKRKVPETVGNCFALIEKEMIKGPWVMGQQYTVADPYLFTVAGWLPNDGIDIARFPKVAAHFARMKERPSVIKALASARS